jgi:hypothetical protein
VQFRVVTDALLQLALVAAVFDCATERHAALVFLLTTGLDGAVAVFVVPGHFGVSQCEYGEYRIGSADDMTMTAW